MQRSGGISGMSPDEILARAMSLYAVGGRLEGHARQTLLAERNNASYVGTEWAEKAGLRRAAADEVEGRTAKKNAQRLRKAANGGDARDKVNFQRSLALPLSYGHVLWCGTDGTRARRS